MAKRTPKKQTEATGMASAANCTIAELHCRFVHCGDHAACAEIVKRCRGMVLATARRVVSNIHDAEDVCQGTFEKYLKEAATLRNPKALPGWLRTVATHLAQETVVGRKRHQGPEVLKFAPSSETSPDHAVEHADTLAALRQEQSRLPESQRALLEDILQGGLTWREAAEKRGTTQGPIQQARETLLARLSRRLCDVIGALLAALWPKGDASASVLPAIGKPAAAAPGSRTAALTVAMKILRGILAGMRISPHSIVTYGSNFVCVLVVLFAFYLVLLPVSEASPTYLLAKLDYTVSTDEKNALTHIRVRHDVFAEMPLAPSCPNRATRIGFWPGAPDIEKDDDLHAFIRPMTNSRLRFHKSMHPDAEADFELFIVSSAEAKLLGDELTKRSTSTSEARLGDRSWCFPLLRSAAMPGEALTRVGHRPAFTVSSVDNWTKPALRR